AIVRDKHRQRAADLRRILFNVQSTRFTTLMHRFVVRHRCRWVAVALVVMTSAGCSKSETAQARGRDESAKRVKTEVVRQEPVHRTVEVVGTLAAEDEVTVSSQVEGVV